MADLPNWVVWCILLSPIWLTPLLSYPVIRQAAKPIGTLSAMALSVPPAIPGAIAWAILGHTDNIGNSLFFAFIIIFGWASTFGGGVVALTQWRHLEATRIISKGEK